MPNRIDDQSVFTAFNQSNEIEDLVAKGLKFSLHPSNPNPLCLLAVQELQRHLQEQKDWEHNFGLSADMNGRPIGKMFGVLVVRTNGGELGYLSGFSGKLANGNHHKRFVPPIFDGLAPGGFLNAGMEELGRLTEEINTLIEEKTEHSTELFRLKAKRKLHSFGLQNKLFEQYHFLNKTGQTKSVTELFERIGQKPPAGAGECAAPKLLQYAFANDMEPLGLAEFWWGKSPNTVNWKHGQYYAPCREKCAPILAHMLDFIAVGS